MSHTVLEDPVIGNIDSLNDDSHEAGFSSCGGNPSSSRLLAHLRRLRRGSLPHAWRVLGRSALWGTVSVGIIAVTISMTFALILWPQPRLPEEFSHLLASDTFAQGHLANPAHPLSKFFTAPQVLHTPQYASPHPPGQGLMLALGQTLFGTPLAGVWISMALAAMALVYMLRGWVPGRWALFGGLVLALHTNIQIAWGYSYAGAALPFAGGALLLGAFSRLLKTPYAGTTFVLTGGAMLLAITRPYEGFVLCAGVGALLLWQQARGHLSSWKTFVLKIACPALLMQVPGAVYLGVYYQAVTGNPFQLPSVSEEASETIASVAMWKFYFGGVLSVLLIASPQVIRDRRLHTTWILLVLLLAASLLLHSTSARYLAPVAPLLFLVLVEGVRHIRATYWRTWTVAKLAPGVLLGMQLLVLFTAAFHLATDPPFTWADDRAKIHARLANQPGRHLILVEYAPNHNTREEWVYNGADLQQAKVLWAHSLGPAANEPLRLHYADRTVWNLRVSNQTPHLEKLPAVSSKEAAVNPFADED